jgi:hypothetical protein
VQNTSRTIAPSRGWIVREYVFFMLDLILVVSQCISFPSLSLPNAMPMGSFHDWITLLSGEEGWVVPEAWWEWRIVLHAPHLPR